MSKDIREELKAYYLDYLNNYISVRVWAQDNNLGLLDGTVIIELGKRLHEEDAVALEKNGLPKEDDVNIIENHIVKGDFYNLLKEKDYN